MRFVLPVAVAALLAAAGASDALARTSVLETEPHTFTVTKDHRIRLNFPVGELKVVPGEASQVRFELRVRCRSGSPEHCESMANRLELNSEDRDGVLRLSLDHYPKWHSRGFNVIATLRVPRSLPLEVDMGVGQLGIEGLDGDIEVDLGVGEADIHASRTRASHVSVDAGIGDASIRGGGSNTSRRGFIGSHASWSEGSGRSSVRLHVGVGEGTVRLD